MGISMQQNQQWNVSKTIANLLFFLVADDDDDDDINDFGEQQSS